MALFDLVLTGIPQDNSSEEAGGALTLDTSLLRNVVLNKNEGLDLKYEVKVYDGERGKHMVTNVSFDSPIPVHQDLLDVFRDLGAHLAYMTDQVTEKTKGLRNRIVERSVTDKDDEIFSHIYCKQVVLKGSAENDDEALMLFGGRRLKNKMHLSINGSLVKLNETSSGYSEVVALAKLVDDLRHEIGLYLGGKRKPFVQMEVDFSSED